MTDESVLKPVDMTMFSHTWSDLSGGFSIQTAVQSAVAQWMGTGYKNCIFTDPWTVAGPHQRVERSSTQRPYALWQREMCSVAKHINSRLVMTGDAPPTAWAYFAQRYMRGCPTMTGLPLLVQPSSRFGVEVVDLQAAGIWNAVLQSLRRAWYGRRVFDVNSLGFCSSEAQATGKRPVVAFYVTCDSSEQFDALDVPTIRAEIEAAGKYLADVVDVRPTRARLAEIVYKPHEADFEDIAKDLRAALECKRKEYGGANGALGGVALVSTAPAAIQWFFGANVDTVRHGPLMTFERNPRQVSDHNRGSNLELAFTTRRDDEPNGYLL